MATNIEFHGQSPPAGAKAVAEKLAGDLPWPEGAEIRIVFTGKWHCFGSSIYSQEILDLCEYEPVAVPEFPFVVISLESRFRKFWRSTLAHELQHLSDWMLRPHDRKKKLSLALGSLSKMYLNYPWERRAFLFQIRYFPDELHLEEVYALEALRDAGFLEES